MTIHYNKLQADPKQGMSLDIGKLGQNGGVQWPHDPAAPGLPLDDSASVVSWLCSLAFVTKPIYRAEEQGRVGGRPGGAIPAAVPRDLSLVSHCPCFTPHLLPALSSGTLLS